MRKERGERWSVPIFYTFLVFPSLCGHDHEGQQHHDEGGKQATHSEKHTESSAVAEQNCSFQ